MKSFSCKFVICCLALFLRWECIFSEETAAPSQIVFQQYELEFRDIIGGDPELHLIADGFTFTEGPVFFLSKEKGAEGYFFFTEMAKDTIHLIQWNGITPFNRITPLSYSKSVIFRKHANVADGLAADLEGNLLAAEFAARRISITRQDGESADLVSDYLGKPFNSPNDLTVKSDGTVWFTDSSYGCQKFSTKCQLPNAVYRFDPKTKDLKLVISDLVQPNGIAFSADELVLYVTDTGALEAAPGVVLYSGSIFDVKKPHAIYAYDVSRDGKTLSNKRLFADISPGIPDGIRVDTNGNLYVSSYSGVQVLNSLGKLIGKIALPNKVANITFGGKNNNILFICATSSIYAVKLNSVGAKPVSVLRMAP